MSQHRGPRPAAWLVALGIALVVGGTVLLVSGQSNGGQDQASLSVASDTASHPPSPQPAGPSPAASAAASAAPSSKPRSPGALAVSEPSAGPDRIFRPGDISSDTPKARLARQASPEQAAFAPTSIAFGDGSGGANARVDTVGTLASGSLELPEDPSHLGWWSGGSRAGAPYGSVVLAGHLDSRDQGLGFAARMTGLSVGDEVSVSTGDRERRYRVKRAYLLPRTRLTALTALFSDRGDARLVMITCGGSYDSDAGAYSDNLVVEATPIG